MVFFDILTVIYIFYRLEKRGRGRRTYLRLIILKKKNWGKPNKATPAKKDRYWGSSECNIEYKRQRRTGVVFFDILTVIYIFYRLEKRGRGRRTYLRLIILKKKNWGKPNKATPAKKDRYWGSSECNIEYKRQRRTGIEISRELGFLSLCNCLATSISISW